MPQSTALQKVPGKSRLRLYHVAETGAVRPPERRGPGRHPFVLSKPTESQLTDLTELCVG
jgi:hypothetical protein